MKISKSKIAAIAILILALHFESYGQVPFTQVGQAPLLLNASLAGSKEKNRISFILNRNAEPEKNSVNGYISFDKVVKKIGSGIGGYYCYSKVKEDTSNIKERNLYYKSPGKFSTKFQSHAIGFSIAPKYNLFRATQKIKFSFSPSINFEYKYSMLSKDLDYQSFYHLTFNSTNPFGIRTDDSISYKEQKFNVHDLKFSLGFQLNSTNALILYKTSYLLEVITEKESATLVDLASDPNKNPQRGYTYNKSWERFTNTYSQSSLHHSLTLGRTFNLKKETIALSCLAGIGLYHSLNNPAANSFNSFNEANGKSLKVNYTQISTVLKVKRILVGGGYTGTINQDFAGIIFGYQSPALRISSAFRFGTKTKTTFIELATTYLF